MLVDETYGVVSPMNLNHKLWDRSTTAARPPYSAGDVSHPGDKGYVVGKLCGAMRLAEDIAPGSRLVFLAGRILEGASYMDLESSKQLSMMSRSERSPRTEMVSTEVSEMSAVKEQTDFVPEALTAPFNGALRASAARLGVVK